MTLLGRYKSHRQNTIKSQTDGRSYEKCPFIKLSIDLITFGENMIDKNFKHIFERYIGYIAIITIPCFLISTLSLFYTFITNYYHYICYYS